MKFLFLLIASGVFAASIDRNGLNSNLDLDEDEFLDEFHLPPVDDPVERARRAEALEQHQHEVQEVNEAFMAGNKTWYDAINEFSDIPDDEFLETHTGLVEDEERRYDERSEKFYDAYRYSRQSIPASYNSVSLGHVSPVKSQGSCGSCAAFATMGLVETCFKKVLGVFGDYSEQHFLDCGYNGQNINGCNGASVGGYAQWLTGDDFNGDLASEAEYSYTGVRGTCRSDFSAFYQGAKISDMYYTWSGDEETMARLVAEHGAVMTAVGVNSGFSSYSGGVYAGCTGDSINHGVVVVGYGTEDGVDYWLVKNSWGSSWGDEGYIKVQRGVGMCGIGRYHVTLSCEEGTAPAPTTTPAPTSAPGPSPTSGEIQSPDYPDRYPHNQNQTWNLEVAAGETIELTFESFDIESHRNCAYDYVLVSYGSVEQKYCGSTKPDPVISSGNTMTVTFHSDYSVNLNGFKATWKVAETSDKIQSPNFPENYPINVDETWNLEVAAGQKIKLTFDSFDLEANYYCSYDYVQVSFGSVEEKHCGSTKPEPIISSGNNMTVTFHSDYSVNHAGFNATWEAVAN